MSFEARIKELGLAIPEPPRPAGRFVPSVQAGNLIFVSGQVPIFQSARSSGLRKGQPPSAAKGKYTA